MPHNLPDGCTLADIDGPAPATRCFFCRDDIYDTECNQWEGEDCCCECYDEKREAAGMKCAGCCDFFPAPLPLFRGKPTCPACHLALQPTIEWLITLAQNRPVDNALPIIITLLDSPGQHYEVHESWVADKQIHLTLTPVTAEEWAQIEQAAAKL